MSGFLWEAGKPIFYMKLLECFTGSHSNLGLSKYLAAFNQGGGQGVGCPLSKMFKMVIHLLLMELNLRLLDNHYCIHQCN
ncbi:hypothetical protein DSECCO2_501880 [anaerobic digester metagenome]